MSDIGTMLADTAERLFLDHGDAIARAQSDGQWPGDAWAAIEESGLPLVLVPEANGGFGVPTSEAFSLIRQTGRHALALPLADTIVANALLAAAGLPLAEGPAAIGVAGEPVAWGRHARVAVIADGDRLIRVDAPTVREQGTDLADQPSDLLETNVGDTRELAPGAPTVRELGALARALQIAGALERLLELTVDHVSTREQFGRPLAKFQAIQQELAKLAGEVAAASAAADLAADAFEDGRHLSLAIAVARTRIGEAAGKSANIAHQLHGAIGFTREHQLHRYTKALWAWRDAFGSQRYWTLRLGEHALRSGREGYWPMVVAA
ncbi:acyl-CoA dehydrogenase family protein [Sphingomonas sp. NBWT7]|uniref:acyl-CoA dehydrogenase family protein n=1 Tax=Sphingomonas sp. NBWT7 TaxID=2596913 RepID=UPI00162555E7|nr:acyl-CoA dehydrogenase family protein [Sphingomonas sp. NBWT7]